jgi:hypothetical protein
MKMSHFVAVPLVVNAMRQDFNGIQPKERVHPLSNNVLLFYSSTRSVWHKIQVNMWTCFQNTQVDWIYVAGLHQTHQWGGKAESWIGEEFMVYKYGIRKFS